MKSSQFPSPVKEVNHDADAMSAVIKTQHTIAVSNFDLRGKLVYIIEQARRITNAGGAVIGLRNGDEIVCFARAGFLGPPLGARLDPYSGISGECIRTGELLYCEDTETDSRGGGDIFRLGRRFRRSRKAHAEDARGADY
jgi:hypothetical protein